MLCKTLRGAGVCDPYSKCGIYITQMVVFYVTYTYYAHCVIVWWILHVMVVYAHCCSNTYYNNIVTTPFHLRYQCFNLTDYNNIVYHTQIRITALHCAQLTLSTLILLIILQFYCTYYIFYFVYSVGKHRWYVYSRGLNATRKCVCIYIYIY